MMQPNINIPLFIVSPEERRDKVFREVNRPTFSRLPEPLSNVCRFISFEALKEGIAKVKEFTSYLKPEFLDEISESCNLDED